MNKKQLIEMFRQWRDEEDNPKIIATVLALPENIVDDEILSWLAQAYIDIGEYKRAIAVLESRRESMESDYKWQFMMGLALLRAADDDECDDDDDLKISILERAKVCIARGMNMNPPADILDSADRFMEEIEGLLDDLNDGEEDFDDDAEAYDEDELDAVEGHIKEFFGDFPTVFHEVTSKDIVIDIACIPPSEERNYYTLVTIGMGAHAMNIPEALPFEENCRAELMICLPPDWKLGESAEEWFWPISLLKDLAKLPINTDSWLGWGHSVDHRGFVAPNTGFVGSFLMFPEDAPNSADFCTLPNGDRVNFFEVVPLYREELMFKIANGTRELLEKLKGVNHVVDINRPNTCEDCNEEAHDNDDEPIIDSAKYHGQKIIDKQLPLNPICGANHIAIFLRWCILHDYIAPEFYEHFPDVVKDVKSGKLWDLRQFLLDEFRGCLMPFVLGYVGANFCGFYYNWDSEAPEYFYPSDVDYYAEKYFGTERYNSEEFQDEAYLFVPFDEEYYNGMAKLIDRAFADFFPGFAEDSYNEDVETAKLAEQALGIPLTLPKYDEVEKTFRTTEYMAKAAGQSALPIIIDKTKTDSAEAEEIVSWTLLDAADSFLETIAIAKFPTPDPVAWAEQNLKNVRISVVPPNERIVSLQDMAKEMIGAFPALLKLGAEPPELYLPLENGVYLRIKIDG
ncbi:MAG: suppressor of fused domain protein [Oscillospiraceae bacterium]|nr:suppressor of fused domain protein [Oscillospiraceae bacterium]